MMAKKEICADAKYLSINFWPEGGEKWDNINRKEIEIMMFKGWAPCCQGSRGACCPSGWRGNS